MSVDLGDLTGLATALGLLDGDGVPRPGWFADPQRFLKRTLSDPEQRAALLGSVDDLLGGSQGAFTHNTGTDSAGRTWVPLLENGPVAVSAVVEERAGGAAVAVGLGVRVHHLAESGVAVSAEVQVPLFAASGTSAVANPLLLGTSGADVQARLAVDLPPGTTAGDVALAGVEVTARIPTAGGEPAAGLVLRGLRMPGSPAPADLVVDAAALDALDDALLELVLGLVRAQAAGLAESEPARAMAGLLGLVAGDGVPDLPVDDLLASGPAALAGWWAQCVQEARDAWLGHLATLLSGTVSGGEVAIPLGGATVTAGVSARPGPTGLPRVVPHLRVAVDGGPGTTLRLDVEPVAVDLAAGTAVAVPTLQLAARVAGADGAPLLGPVDGPGGLDVTVGSIEAGFALDAARRPVLVLRARDAVVGATGYPTLDLTDGDALAGAAGDALGAAARSLLTPLGPLGDAVAVLLGLDRAPAIDPVLLLRDPIAALRERWAALLAAGGDAVREVLQTWQRVTAAEALRAVPVTGDGTPAAPYRVRLTDGVDLLLTVEGPVASLAVAAHVAAPFALGADLTADVRLGLLRADVSPAAPSAELGTGLLAVLALTGNGEPVRLVADGYGVTARSLGARVAWSPATGARVDPWLDAPRLVVAGSERPLDGLGVGGPEGLALPPVPLPDPAGWAAEVWEAVEAVAGAALAAARSRATGELAALLAAADELTGWLPRPTPPDGPTPRPRLSLAALATDPSAELERWVRSLLGLDGETADTAELLARLLARLLGTAAPLGAGVPVQPWTLPLDPQADVPALLLALGLPTPERLASRAAQGLVDWQPGDDAIRPDLLAAALAADAGIDDVLAAATAGRASLDAGLAALVERWAGTDGVVALAADALPAGIVAHRPADLLHTERLDSAAVTAALAGVWSSLGGPAQRVVLVGITAAGEPDLLPPPAPGDVDLTLADAPPEAFRVPPAMAPGTAVVRLAGKAASGGFPGQVARLRRALSGLATAAAPVAVVAGGAAGRVAVAAAAGLPGIDAVVTVGTPWTPLTLADVDTQPAADALRTLRTLLDLVGETDADTADLGRARGLVTALLGRDVRGDPLHELSAPDLPVPAGLAVHAVVGSFDADAVRRALTAAVAKALSARALERTATAVADAAVAALGVRVPRRIGTAAGGVRADVRLDADLTGGPVLRLALLLSGDGRWLVGGPDPARVPGPRPLALRAVELDLVLGSAPSGRLVLHDAAAFGVSRARWPVNLADGAPLLPEVRALLGEVAAQLRATAEGTATAAADTAIAGLVEALTAIGLLDVAGGFDATTLAGLLADPRAVLDAALADATRTSTLAAGLRAAVGDTREGAGSTVELRVGHVAVGGELAARTLRVGSSTGLLGVDLTAGPDGVEVAARLGAGGLTGGGPPAAALELAATLPADADPILRASGVLRDPRGTRRVPLWPAPAPADLLGLVPDAAVATVLNAVLTALRSALAALPPDAGGGPPAATTPAALVDAVLAAAGLLRGADAVAFPSGLLSDPAAWVRTAAGELRAAVPPLVDAVAGLLPAAVPHPPGSVALAPGVVLRTAAAPDRLHVALDVDAAGFPGTPPGLALHATAGVAVTASGARPDVRAELAAGGVGAVRLMVGGDPAVTVTLVPAARPEVVLHPAGGGLSGLADAAAAGAVAALPALLTRLAAEDPAGDPTTAVQVAGRIVARAGTALGLATGAPAEFDPAALAAFAADPADAFAARSASLVADGLARLSGAVQPVLGAVATRSVAVADGRLAVTLGPAERRVVLGWRPGAGTVDVALALTGVPGIAAFSAQVRIGSGGIEALDVAVAPAPVALGATTLTPSARVVAGSGLAAPTVDIALGAGTGERLLVRLGPAGRQVLAATGSAESDVPLDVARAVVGVVLDLAGGLVLGVPAVQAALSRPVLGTASTADLLDGALLAAGRLDAALATSLSDAAALLRRLAVVAGNVAAAMPAPVSVGNVLEVRVVRAHDGLLSLALAVSGDEWVLNPGSDLQVGLVTDAGWIDPEVPAGLVVDVLRLTDSGVEPAPGVVVGGLGVRVSRESGPLLDAAVRLDAASVLGFGLVRSAGGGPVQLGGGARVELEGIALPLAGAQGGDNAVARGLMPSGGSAGDDAPAPRFSPALAVQQHPGGEPAVSLRAGPGDGPWFLAVQRDFGPVYLEQVGLAVGQDGRRLRTIGVLVDGKVTLFGLSAAVDDLSLTYDVEGGSSPFDPTAWSVDVAGFAVTADTAGLTLAGGLRKFTPAEGGVEYLGMLLARLGVYGLTVYGGFGQVGPPGDQYSSLFLFGAVNGPIGGPPAFFVTGIGGGFGANRGLVVPADLSRFGDYPLVKALDPAARAGDPFTELAEARRHFPAARGQFWFAAGMSFTSFALVDGVVVVAVSFGNGVELSILGLARMALPRPEAALVSIELALVARVSTREGVVLVQAQLTDNSWLLAPAVRLTGGFAFASWFAGPNRGQFVLTLGGYHPDFRREGYPVVPRLGLAWSLGSAVTLHGGAYFALTSEALMAGLKVEVHAQLGPAWAHLVFGADGIVFFDPFWLKVTVYASIDAGVTIDLWLGEITISVHLAARLTVTGPPFHAKATFEIGPVDVTFEIGPSTREPAPLTWAQFVPKYLEEAAPGLARALTAVTGAGTVPPAGSAASGGDKSPDGQPDQPFRVVAEFTATVTSTVPLRELTVAGATTTLVTSHLVSVAPMGPGGTAAPRVTLSVRSRLSSGGPDPAAPDRIAGLDVTAKRDGAFPIGAWGPAQDLARPAVPSGDVLAAADRVELVALADIPGAGSSETPAIPYRQVETGKRRVLPLLPRTREDDIEQLETAAATLKSALEEVRGEIGADLDPTTIATRLLAERGERAELAVAAWRAGLAAPVLLGSLGEGLGGPAAAVDVAATAPEPPAQQDVRPPRVLAVLSSGEPRPVRDGTARLGAATSVSDRLLRELVEQPATVRLVAPPSTDRVGGDVIAAVPARVALGVPRAQATQRTAVATGTVPVTSSGLAGAVGLLARTATPATRKRLAERTESLLGGATQVADGDVVVLELPDADTDTDEQRRPALVCREGRVRVVLLGAGGRVLADVPGVQGVRVPVPVGTRSVVVVGGPPPDPVQSPWAVGGGWTPDRPLPSATDGLLVAAGCVVDVLGRVPERGPDPVRAAWVRPAELLGAERGVATTVSPPPELVVAAVAVAVTGAGTDGLSVGVDGARQTGPLTVAADPTGASVVVVGLAGAEAGRPVTVTVAGAGDRDVLGLTAAVGRAFSFTTRRQVPAAEWLGSAVADAGLAALVPPPTTPGPARSTLAWEAP